MPKRNGSDRTSADGRRGSRTGERARAQSRAVEEVRLAQSKVEQRQAPPGRRRRPDRARAAPVGERQGQVRRNHQTAVGKLLVPFSVAAGMLAGVVARKLFEGRASHS